jgi:hypothetical protein
MRIPISIDVEDAVRLALSDYITTYCRPLPKDFAMPSILVTKTGGTDADSIDQHIITLDARAKTEAEADRILRTAIGILKACAALHTTPIKHITVNSSGSWGVDPVRPDICLCTATLEVIAHQTTTEV